MNNAYVFSIIEHNSKLCVTQSSKQQDYMIFLSNLSSKQWKQRQGHLEVQRCWSYKDMVRKAQADLELTLEKDTKGNMKGFCKQIRSRKKTREDTDLWQSEQRPWRWMHLMLSCLSIYQKKMVLRSPWSLRLAGKSAARKNYLQLREDFKHMKVCILVAEGNSILLCTGKSVKQAKGVDPTHLLSTVEPMSVVLCPALGYPVHRPTEGSLESQSWLRDWSIWHKMRGCCTHTDCLDVIFFHHYECSN